MTLEPITTELAARIIARDERPGDAWHPDYPFEDELDPVRALAARDASDPVFTLYIIRDEGLAVGGFGFYGPPDETGTVEFGYGLIPAARGRGLATDAVVEGLRVASSHGARRAIADTDIDNVPSQRVLLKAGLTETHRSSEKVFYARELS